LEKKDDNELFEEVNHKKRKDDSKEQLGKKAFSKKIIQNDMVLFQLYSRYREMVGELDVYRDKVMENLRFEEKHKDLLLEDYRPRKRSNSVEFKVFKVKEGVLGKVRLDYVEKMNPEKELNNWNQNLNERLEEIENYCKKIIPKKFNDTIRNRGLLAQEMRVMESTLNHLKADIEDLKTNAGQKSGDDAYYKNSFFGGNDIEGPISVFIKQGIDNKFKSITKAFEREYAEDIKSLEMQLVKIEGHLETKVDKSYVDSIEVSLNSLIKQSKSSNSVANVLKELSDDIIKIKDRLGKEITNLQNLTLKNTIVVWRISIEEFEDTMKSPRGS
jgi:methylphosphotriester-DNA--protein-cysteine methyltransferase